MRHGILLYGLLMVALAGNAYAYTLYQNLCFPLANGTPCFNWTGSYYTLTGVTVNGTGGDVSGITVTNSDGYTKLSTNGTNVEGAVNLTAFDARYLLLTSWATYFSGLYTNVTNLQTANSTAYAQINAIKTVDGTQNSSISANAADITTIKTVDGTQNTSINSLQTNVGTLVTNLSSLSTFAQTKAATGYTGYCQYGIAGVTLTNGSAPNITCAAAQSSSDFTGLYTNVTNLQTSNTTIFAQLTAIKNDDSTQNTSISSLQTNVGTLVTNLTSVRDGLYTNVTALQTSNTSTGADISAIKTVDATQNSTLAGLYTNVTNLQTSNTTIFAQLTAIKNDDSTQNTSISNLNTANSTLNTRINQVNTTVAGLLTTETTQNSSISAAQADITAIKTVDGTQNTSISSLQTNVGTLVTNLSSLSTFAQTKAATGYTGYCQYGIAGVTLTNGSAPNVTCAAAQGGGGNGTSPFDATGNLTQDVRLNGYRLYTSDSGTAYISASPSYAPRLYFNGGGEAIEWDNYQYVLLANQINEFQTYYNGVAGLNITNTYGGTAIGNLWVQNSVYANETCYNGVCLGQRVWIPLNVSTSNNTVYVNTNLSLILPNASNLIVRCELIEWSAAASTGIQLQVNTTGSPLWVRQFYQSRSSATAMESFTGTSTSSNSYADQGSAGTNIPEPAMLITTMRTGSSASNMTIWARSEIAASQINFAEGSWCQYERRI